MASLIRMPQKGLSEDSAILSKWYVKEGDTVKKGDFVFAIETGKATFDVESEQDGTVLKCIGEEGDEIAVKEIVCVVGKPGEPFSLGGKAAPAVGGGLNHPVVNGRDLFGVGHTVADDAGKHRLGRRLQCGVVHRFGVDAEIGDIAAVPLLRQLEIAGDNGRNQRQDGGKVGAPVGRGIQRQAASRVVGLDEALGDEGLIAAGSRRRQQQAGQSNRQRQNKGKDFFHDRLLL